MAFICATCGQEHDEWPPDWGTSRPDVIWNLPAGERQERAKEGDDFCMLDGSRFFIRAVLPIPLRDRPGTWGLGLWVEVTEADCRRYYNLYEVDATGEPGFGGCIANALPCFPDALGLAVHVKLGTASQRPTLWCDDGAATAGLPAAQKLGMTDGELHQALDA